MKREYPGTSLRLEYLQTGTDRLVGSRAQAHSDWWAPEHRHTRDAWTRLHSLPREEVPLALVGLLLLPLLYLQARDKDNLTQWPSRLSGPAHLAGGREVLWGRVVRLVVARQRLFGCRDVHVVAATGLGLVSVPPQHVELWSLWLLPWLQPAHLDGVHQPRHLLGFPARRDKAALWLDCVAQRVNPLLTAKEIHVGLREKAVSLHSSTTTHSIYNVYSN